MYLPHNTDGHTGQYLQQPQGQRTNQDSQRIRKGSKERGQSGKGCVRADQLRQTGEKVTQEASGKRSHHKRTDPAQDQKPGHMLHRSARPQLPAHKNATGEHEKPVSHIGHHHSKKEDEKGSHKRVGIHPVIGGIDIHVGDHIERAGEPVVFELDRHLRVFVRLRISGLPGGGVLREQMLYVGKLFRRNPTLQKKRGCRGEQFLFRLHTLDILRHAVYADLKRGLVAGLLCQPSPACL